MTIILISSDDHETSQSVAKTTADKLGFRYLGTPFLLKIASRFELQGEKLRKSLCMPPDEKPLSGKPLVNHLARIASAVLEELTEDNIVCEGLAAHLYVQDVSHILTARVLGDPEAVTGRIEKEQKVSKAKASKIMERRSATRVKWSTKAFLKDESDISAYDMVLNLASIDPEKAAEVIDNMAGYRKFRSMTYSRSCLADLALAAKLRVALLPKFSDFKVEANKGTAIVTIKCSKGKKAKIAGEIKVLANAIPDIKFVEVHATASKSIVPPAIVPPAIKK